MVCDVSTDKRAWLCARDRSDKSVPSSETHTNTHALPDQATRLNDMLAMFERAGTILEAEAPYKKHKLDLDGIDTSPVIVASPPDKDPSPLSDDHVQEEEDDTRGEVPQAEAVPSSETEQETMIPMDEPAVEENDCDVSEGVSVVSDGVSDVSDGVSIVSDGVSVVSEGVSVVSDGVSVVSDGVSIVSDGVSDVSDGVSEVSDGVNVVSDGVSVVSDGVSVVSDGVSVVSDGVSVVSDGVSDVSDGVSDVSDGVSVVSDGVSDVSDGVSVVSDGGGSDVIVVTSEAASDEKEDVHTPEVDVMDWIYLYRGRDILDLSANLRSSSSDMQFAVLPPMNLEMFWKNSSQYHRLGNYGDEECNLVECQYCSFQYILPKQ